MLPYMLVNVSGKPRSFFSQEFHFGNGGRASAFIGINIYRAIPEFYVDAVFACFVGNYTGVSVGCFVRLHTYIVAK